MAEMLVAYFSYSGNAKKTAQRVAELAKADLFEIKPKEAYSTDYQQCIEEARKEVSEGARPELMEKPDDLNKYDTIVLGFPNWCSTCPMVILSFLEAYDLTGKKIYSFVTNGGGGCGNSIADIKNSSGGAKITESINGNDLTDDQIREWLGI